jgi:hypothetical protein
MAQYSSWIVIIFVAASSMTHRKWERRRNCDYKYIIFILCIMLEWIIGKIFHKTYNGIKFMREKVVLAMWKRPGWSLLVTQIDNQWIEEENWTSQNNKWLQSIFGHRTLPLIPLAFSAQRCFCRVIFQSPISGSNSFEEINGDECVCVWVKHQNNIKPLANEKTTI